MNSLTKSFTTTTGNRNTISLTKSDIGQVKAQAMITSINPAGAWYGAIDGVIDRACGTRGTNNQFHNQVRDFSRTNRLEQNTVIVAKKKTPHRGAFDDVIFVIDNPSGPLSDTIYAPLQAAGASGYTDLSLPAIRTGVMLGKVERDAKEAVAQLLMGITRYYTDYPESSISNLNFVIYDGGEVYNLLQSTKQIGSSKLIEQGQ